MATRQEIAQQILEKQNASKQLPYEEDAPVLSRRQQARKLLAEKGNGGKGTIADSLGQGVSMGFSDEIAGAGGAAVAHLIGDAPEGESFGETYELIRDNAREQNADFSERNPNTALAAEIAGGLLTGGAGAAKALPAASKLAGKVVGDRAAKAGGGALIGAVEGGFAGAGSSDADSAGDIATDTLKGAAIGAPLGAVGGEVARYFDNKNQTNQRIVDLLENDPENADRAGKVLGQSTTGKVKDYVTSRTVDKFRQKFGKGADNGTKEPTGKKAKTDKLSADAVNAGFDKGVIAPIQAAKAEDAKKMLRMAKMMQRGNKDKRYQVENRPADVAGESLKDRVDYVLNVNKTAAKQLDSTAKTLKGENVPFDDVIGDFTGKLDDMGITLAPNDSGRLEPNFIGSDIEGLTGVEKIVKNVINRMTSGEKIDGYDIHRMKKYIDENVSYGKRTEGLTGKIEGVLKGLRRGLDQRLDETFPEYDRVNTTYSETRGAIDELQGAVGNKLDLTGNRSEAALGQELRKIMSNYKSRNDLLTAIPSIEDTAAAYGGKFDDDLIMQSLFANELDRVFKPVARTSMEGIGGRATEAGAAAAMGDKLGAAMKFFKGGDDKQIDDSFDAIIKLLERGAKTKTPSNSRTVMTK